MSWGSNRVWGLDLDFGWKRWWLFLGCLVGFMGPAFGQDEVSPFDGPYVRYRDGKTEVTEIAVVNGVETARQRVFEHGQRVSFRVAPEGHAEWGFSVRLRDTLLADPVVYPAAEKTLLMSDIEGEFGPFRKLLLAAGVIDTAYRWTYGRGALVIPGDLFDRGRDVVPELWLLYKLEEEAKAAGGSVQVILGNHDVMNLSGDHRYTDAKFFKSAWLLGRGIDGLFGADTELGRWLRSKNVIEKCGGVLVMHGGMSPAVLSRGLSLERLNALCRAGYGLKGAAVPDSLRLFFGRDALFWYRGYFMAPKASMALVDSTLALYGVNTILVGHTIVKWNIASYYGGKVIGVDVDEHKGDTQAALLMGGHWFVLSADGSAKPLLYKPANDLVKEDDIL